MSSSQEPEVRPLNPLYPITVSFRGRAKRPKRPKRTKKNASKAPQGKVCLSASVGKDIPARIEAIRDKLEEFYGRKTRPSLLIDRLLRLGMLNAEAAFEAIHKLEQQKETDKYGIQRHRPEGDLGDGGTRSPGSQQDNASSEGIQADGECNSLCGAGLVEHESQAVWQDDKD